MQRLAETVTKYKRAILIVFLAMFVLSIVGLLQVGVNYDMASYLPQETESTKAIRVMQSSFDSELPNLSVMMPVADVGEALELKHELLSFPFVNDVLWLDDQVDMTRPLDLHDTKLTESFYKDDHALYTVTIGSDIQAADAVETLRTHLTERVAMSGQLIEMASAQKAVKSEMSRILIFAVPIALVILLLSTASWLEPLIFLFTITIAVALNFGTNIILGDVSFITQSVAGVLQMAVTMDYTIYLLHRFSEYRQLGVSDEKAMQKAIVKSLPAVAASALTTFFGFLALVFMRFGIGSNLGIVLAKGVALSFITVILLLPVLVLLLIKPLDKLMHKNFWPSFKKLGRASVGIGTVVVIIALIVSYPLFNASRHNRFLYGMGAYPTGSVEAKDLENIKDRFGQREQMVILVPRDNLDKQANLVSNLKTLPEITSVMDYTEMVGRGIPSGFIPEVERRQLISDSYSRLIVVADMPTESERTFELAEHVRAMTADYFPEDNHLIGSSFSLVDMRDTIQKDDLIVNGLAILAVALVIMLTFKSFLLPLLLVFTIELSIWLNLAIPFLQGTPINYIGYLVISTVQLGATVDYAILLSQNYLDNRRKYPKWQAASRSAGQTARTVIPPALILAGAGFSLYFISSISVVSELGLVLGRGALISLFMVIFFLPAALARCDGLLDRLSFGRKRTTMKGLTHEN